MAGRAVAGRPLARSGLAVTGPGVGSAAEEAARLLAAAEQWARRRADALDAEHLATGSAECTVCPLCSAVSTLRQVRPEAVGHLLDAAASLVAALQAAVPVPTPTSPRAPGVQHVDIDPEPSWQDPETRWR